MKNNLLRFFLFCSVLCGSQFLSAQCLEHGVDGGSNDFSNSPFSVTFGQTFTASCTGLVTSISVTAASNCPAGTHNFRIGVSNATPTSVLGGSAYQTFTTSGGTETVSINLSPPFPVVAGSIYAFDFETSSSFNFRWQNTGGGDYNGGSQYVNSSFGFSYQDPFDLDFEVQISPSSVASPADVPTLSEWGLLILALLLMTLGTVYLLQPQWREGLNRNS